MKTEIYFTFDPINLGFGTLMHKEQKPSEARWEGWKLQIPASAKLKYLCCAYYFPLGFITNLQRLTATSPTYAREMCQQTSNC